MLEPRRKLCQADEIAEGAARGFDLDGEGEDTIFLVRVGGKLSGWRNACPHIDGAPMAWRRDGYLNAAGNLIVCYAHGAEFRPDTGVCVQGPCYGDRLTPAPIEEDEGALYALVD
jgi:nitrite reductase/ring-hydroxylating ferredoxin subunit